MTLAASPIAQFRTSFRGEVVSPTDDGYNDARRVWCATVDRRPALIVRPVDAADVATAVRFAQGQDLVLALRGGGHSVDGFSTCDDGMVLDLSRMRGVTVDPGARTARANGGAQLGELDRAAQEHGLVCPTGTVGHTGVGGLTLGGGVGRLQRPFGLTLDNLTAVELVTADGRLVRASGHEEPDLFWGIRGAGANFGVVTAFEFGLRPFGPNIVRGLRIYRPSDALAVWDAFRAFLPTAPRELSFSFVIGRAWPDAEYPPEIAGGPVAVVSFSHTGTEAEALAAVAPLDRAAKPVVETAGAQPYLQVQGQYDEAYAWGVRFACGGGFANDVRAATISAVLDHVARGVDDAGVSFTAQGGAIADLPEDAMAYTGRTARLRILAEEMWLDASRDAEARQWCLAARDIVASDTVPGHYVNEVPDDVRGPDAIYGPAKAERLRALKRAWDPDNAFRINHNIVPLG
ncbi:MAG TPA: FAD-binding oxidoreductase [Candidatus Binatus sp.]|nr:FAD-binding oxidoreductase [Candidatus Binatus sp.]